MRRYLSLLLFIGLAWGQEELHGLWGKIHYYSSNEKNLRKYAQDARDYARDNVSHKTHQLFQNKTDYEILDYLKSNYSNYEDLSGFSAGPIWRDHMRRKYKVSFETDELARINAKLKDAYYNRLIKIFESNGKLFFEGHSSSVSTYVIHKPFFDDYYIEGWVTLDENEQEVKRKMDIVLIDKNTILIGEAQYNRINE